jgi:hypothetical protein
LYIAISSLDCRARQRCTKHTLRWIGRIIFNFIVFTVPPLIVYGLVLKVVRLNAETAEQLKILEQFQSQAIEIVSDELYRTVTTTKKNLKDAFQKGDSAPTLLGLRVNARVSRFIRGGVLVGVALQASYIVAVLVSFMRVLPG